MTFARPSSASFFELVVTPAKTVPGIPDVFPFPPNCIIPFFFFFVILHYFFCFASYRFFVQSFGWEMEVNCTLRSICLYIPSFFSHSCRALSSRTMFTDFYGTFISTWAPYGNGARNEGIAHLRVLWSSRKPQRHTVYPTAQSANG